MFYQVVVLSAVAAIFLAPALGSKTEKSSSVSKLCLNCICKAASNCNKDIGCKGNVCGPYKITKAYWIDANRPTICGDKPEDEDAYKNCATDPKCAEKAVQNYLTKFAQDCTGDGKVDCDDFARIHYLGRNNCKGKMNATFAKAVKDCASCTK